MKKDYGTSPRGTQRHTDGRDGEDVFKETLEANGFRLTKMAGDSIFDWRTDTGVRIESKFRPGIFKDGVVKYKTAYFDVAKSFDLIIWHGNPWEGNDDCACWVFNSAPLQMELGFGDPQRPDQKRDCYCVPTHWLSRGWETMFSRLRWLENIVQDVT